MRNIAKMLTSVVLIIEHFLVLCPSKWLTILREDILALARKKCMLSAADVAACIASGLLSRLEPPLALIIRISAHHHRHHKIIPKSKILTDQ